MFTLLCLFRFLSGCKNASYYNNNIREALWFSIGMILVIIGIGVKIYTIFLLLPILFIYLMFRVFMRRRTDLVHLYENLVQYSLILVLLPYVNLVILLLSSLAGNALFNMPIQKQAFGSYINKDMKVKSEVINIPGIGSVHKPRINNGYILTAIGGISILLQILNTFYIHFSIVLYEYFK